MYAETAMLAGAVEADEGGEFGRGLLTKSLLVGATKAEVEEGMERHYPLW